MLDELEALLAKASGPWPEDGDKPRAIGALVVALVRGAPALIDRMRKLEAVAEAAADLMARGPIGYVDSFFQQKHGIDQSTQRLLAALDALKAKP